MGFADEMKMMAIELVGEFDERTGDDRVKLLKQGTQVWNETTFEYDIAVDTEYFLSVVTRNVSAGLVNGTTIQSGDQIMTVSTQVKDLTEAIVNIVPAVNDKILSDGVTWSIVDTPHSNFTGDPLTVVFKLQIRK